mmetsp:Transcript_28255/g.81726  ORF Transcript_28255/g.81726 Transcript_28255/m.81726 type:complete len:198 (+) Transcript_28255:242-835(+)
MSNKGMHRGMSSSGCVRQFAKFCANAEKINKKMAAFCPELSSSYAEYPLIPDDTGRTNWVDLEGTTVQGDPVFVADEVSHSSSTVGSSRVASAERRDDFVYGKGPMGWGYYHLLTRESYVILHKRLQSTVPTACCMNANIRQEIEDHDAVTRVVYARSISPIPDDERAANESFNRSRGRNSSVGSYEAVMKEQVAKK